MTVQIWITGRTSSYEVPIGLTLQIRCRPPFLVYWFNKWTSHPKLYNFNTLVCRHRMFGVGFISRR